MQDPSSYDYLMLFLLLYIIIPDSLSTSLFLSSS